MDWNENRQRGELEKYFLDAADPESNGYQNYFSMFNVPGTDIKYSPMYPTTLGYVDRKDPKTVHMNDLWNRKSKARTLVHEMTHVGQNQVNKPQYLLGQPAHYWDFRKDFEKHKFRKEGVDWSHASNMNDSEREFFANIRELESVLPEGKTIWDTEFGKKYKDPALRRYIDSFVYQDKQLMHETPKGPATLKDVWNALFE